MAKLMELGAGIRSQLIVGVAVLLWGVSSAGLISPDQFDQGVAILGILFGGTMASKVQRLVSEMGSSD
jgi:hypothetical protein